MVPAYTRREVHRGTNSHSAEIVRDVACGLRAGFAAYLIGGESEEGVITV